MSVAKLDFKLRNYELAAYELSRIYIKEGYKTDVIKVDNGYAALLYEGGILKNIASTPVAIKVSFIETSNGSEIEVELVNVVYDAENVVKEILSIVTIIPGTIKLIRMPIVKSKVKKAALKIAVKFKNKEEK